MADKSNDTKTRPDPNREQDDYGYDLFPERRENLPLNWKNYLFSFKGREGIEQHKCEKHIVDSLKESEYIFSPISSRKKHLKTCFAFAGPLLRIMISALRKAGW